MSKFRPLSLLLLCAVSFSLLQSCSNDDNPELPPLESNITIDGNGGSKTISFTPKGLKNITFTNDEYDKAVTTFYTADGTAITPAGNIADVEQIVYTAPPFTLRVNIDGDKLIITSIDNASLSNLHVTMTLDYGYTLQRTDINVTPGYPLEISSITYDWTKAQSGIEKSLSEPMTVTNNGSSPSSITLTPLQDAWSTVRIIPATSDSWQQYVTGFINVPWYVDDKWTLNTTTTIGIYLDKPISYHSAAEPENTTVTVEIAPNSTQKIQTEVSYQSLMLPFSATVVQPNSKTEWPISGTARVRQPYSWEILKQ